MTDAQDLLRANNLSKTYKRRAWKSEWKHAVNHALLDVSVSVGAGQTLGIVGRSGAGKSTLARCLAGLEPPDSGEIWFDGLSLLDMRPPHAKAAQRQIQMIFQHTASSLNPAFSAIEIVTEPLTIARTMGRQERQALGLEMLENVGLARSAADRPCTTFSGGERQRLAIARALTLSPRVLVLDEALTGLDLLIQAQLVNLLGDLQASRTMTYVLISHDLALAAHLADKLAVMHEGRVVEQGTTECLIADPQHPQTREFVALAAQLRHDA